MTTVLPAVTTDPIEQHTEHVDALLADISRTVDSAPPAPVGWIARDFGAEFAAEFLRRRRAQYGFCGFGHVRSVRTVCLDAYRVRTQLCCPTCEAGF